MMTMSHRILCIPCIIPFIPRPTPHPNPESGSQARRRIPSHSWVKGFCLLESEPKCARVAVREREIAQASARERMDPQETGARARARHGAGDMTRTTREREIGGGGGGGGGGGMTRTTRTTRTARTACQTATTNPSTLNPKPPMFIHDLTTNVATIWV